MMSVMHVPKLAGILLARHEPVSVTGTPTTPHAVCVCVEGVGVWGVCVGVGWGGGGWVVWGSSV